MGSSLFLYLMDVLYLLKRKWKNLEESKLIPYSLSSLIVLRSNAVVYTPIFLNFNFLRLASEFSTSTNFLKCSMCARKECVFSVIRRKIDYLSSKSSFDYGAQIYFLFFFFCRVCVST